MRSLRITWVSATTRAGPMAFAAGGLLIVLDAMLQAIGAVLGTAVPEWATVVFGLGGLWLASLGLNGVYAHLAEHARRWAEGGLITGILSWVLLTIGVGMAVLRMIGLLTANGGIGTMVVPVGVAAGLVSFLLYAVGSLRTEHPSRRVGYLLAVPFAGFLVAVLLVVLSNALGLRAPVVIGVAAFGLIGVSVMALGYGLRGHLETAILV